MPVPSSALALSSPGLDAPAATVAELPGPPGQFLLGNMKSFSGAAPHTVIEGWARTYGPMFKFSLGKATNVVITDRELIRQILRARPEEFRRQRKLADAIEETGFKGVFTAEGTNWERQRRLVMQGLTPAVVTAANDNIKTVTSRLAQQWGTAANENRVVDVIGDLKRYSMDIVLWLSLGIDLDATSQPDQPLQLAVDRWFGIIGRRVRQPFAYWHYFKLAIDKQADEAIALLHQASHKAIADTEKTRAQWQGKPRNILEALLNETGSAESESESEFTTDDVFGNAATMLTAGEDTTANAMSWFLYYCAVQPELADDLRQEINSVLLPDSEQSGGENGKQGFAALTPERVRRLPRLQAVCLEVLRRRPVAPMIGLSTGRAVNIAGLDLPAGQLMTLLPRVANEATPDRLGNDPIELANPDAEARMSANAATNQFAFGGGPRLCPGRYLALTEMAHFAVMVLSKFDIELAMPASEVREAFTFTMGPETLPLRLRLR